MKLSLTLLSFIALFAVVVKATPFPDNGGDDSKGGDNDNGGDNDKGDDNDKGKTPRIPHVVDIDGFCTISASGGDDAPNFVAAVKACNTVFIPTQTTLTISTRMDMTGVKNKAIILDGTVKFIPDIPYWTGNAFAIAFQTQITFWQLGGENILLTGKGTLDGQGQAWYNAFVGNTTLLRPIILHIFVAKNVLVSNINMINSPEWFNLIENATDVTFDNVHLSAVSTNASSTIANTDGWDIYRSSNVVLKNSVINNGDDCVSFKPNTTNILVSNLNCNGSHGISVGSLGQFPGVFDIVENVVATNVKMANAQNGARIKCWAGPNVGSGIVKNITFENFQETNVDNPVIIDQCYMTNATACAAFPSNTLIQDVFFNNISGTSSGKVKSVVASLTCSPDGRCSDVNVNNLNLTPPPAQGAATYTCSNTVLEGNAAPLFGTCATT